jgi:uncharacterized protein (TIGR03083 family)
MTTTASVNTMSYEAKPLVLDVVRTERQKLYDLIDDPSNWNVETRCEGWQVRDIVGHMIDVTEGYLARWEVARRGEQADAKGLVVMGESLDDAAKQFRSLSREEAIARLKRSSDQLMQIFDSLSEEQWGTFLVPHPYMGPAPAGFYPAFQVMDYTVHTWDIRYGLGDRLGRLDERSAGVLVPYMFILMQATVDAESARGVDIEYGIVVSGELGGRWHAKVHDGKFEYAPAEDGFEGCQALIQFSPSDFVLTSFKRFPGGCASGDPEVIERARELFFAI